MMFSPESNINPYLADMLPALLEASQSAAIGVFGADAAAVWTNNAMRIFLNTGENATEKPNRFVNPTLDELAATTGEGRIFEGIMTIGNGFDISYALDGQVYKKDNQLLIFAEANIAELFEANHHMSALNQEINNLQRQLIREKRTLEATLLELKETQAMLVQSEKMNSLGKMVAGIAHEINNPIAYVYSNTFSLERAAGDFIEACHEITGLLKQTGDENLISKLQQIKQEKDIEYLIDDIPEMFKETKSGLERVKKIVEDLRKFSRLDESDIKYIDLIENISSTLTIVKSEMAKKNIEFSMEAPNMLYMDCYPGQLNQALLNMLINATQAVEKNGKIKLKVEDLGNEVMITISDNGCGIPKEIQTKIFDPFFTTKDVGSGTGLGLSITYKIITDLHQGKIEVISAPQAGATFKISLKKSI